MARSVKVNYLLTMVNTVTGILFPMLTFPYASRILLADGIGEVNFFYSIISYFSLIACLGIPFYAIRQVAKLKDNPQELSQFTTEILILNGILTTIAYIGVGIMAMFVTKVQLNIPLFLIMSLSIALTAMGCDWFYQGREDFKYITIRGLVVKTLAVIMLFVLVKEPSDVIWYGLYMVVGSVGGNVFNIVRLRKFVKRKHIVRNELRPMRHFKPAIKLFLITTITTIYLEINTMLLGFMDDNATVGYYAGASRIMRIALTLIAALSTAVVPRMSEYIKKKEHEKFQQLAQKSYDFTLTLALPMTIGCIIVAPVLIPIFCGDSFDGAIPALMILAPTILAVGIAHVTNIQILFPQGKEDIMLKASIAALIVCLLTSIIFIPLWHQNGAALSMLLTETSVTVTAIILGHKYIPLKFITRRNTIRLVCFAIMGAVCYATTYVNVAQWLSLIITCATGIITVFITLMIMKDPLLYDIITNIRPTKKTDCHSSSK